MSASAHRYSCDQLGACQSRSTPCSTCTSTRPRTSEGTVSAQRLQGLRPWDAPSSRPAPLDGLDLHRVHHVDTHDLEHGQGVSIGGTCLPPEFTRDRGDAHDHHHDYGDAVLRRWAGASLGLGLVLLAIGAWLLAAG